jgi:prephenate dehydrogenase
MKILIVGLGLMGGSYAMGLKEKGHQIYACDINNESIEYAKSNNLIVDGCDDASKYIPTMDMIIIGLYPNYIVDFLKKYNNLFKKGQLITDLCGIKTYFILEAQKYCGDAEYISHHPMAGREKSGVMYANTEMFKKANFLITPTEKNTTHAIEMMKALGLDLEFGRISVVTPEHHDAIIAYTSQLTHAIAVSLVNADTDIDSKNFVGDSYRDLTRIAKINEELWSELFFDNKDALLKKIGDFERELDDIKTALINGDKELLKKKFISSTNHRKEME